MANNSAEKAKVFISYSQFDLEFVDRLVEGLTQRGLEPLIDRRDIKAARNGMIVSSK
jgi:hypothetical protein